MPLPGKYFLVVVLIVLFAGASGCAAFLEDYSYNPIGSRNSINSGSY